jgi:hypothetical protein
LYASSSFSDVQPVSASMESRFAPTWPPLPPKPPAYNMECAVAVPSVPFVPYRIFNMSHARQEGAHFVCVGEHEGGKRTIEHEMPILVCLTFNSHMCSSFHCISGFALCVHFDCSHSPFQWHVDGSPRARVRCVCERVWSAGHPNGNRVRHTAATEQRQVHGSFPSVRKRSG